MFPLVQTAPVPRAPFAHPLPPTFPSTPAWARAHCAATMSALRDARPSTVWPPPCKLLPEQSAAFERAGMPVRSHICYAQRYEGAQNMSWTAAFIDSLCADIAAGAAHGSYGPRETLTLREGLRSLPATISGSIALVMGTEVPWVEALLLNEGARLVYTFEYSSIRAEHPRMKAPPYQTIAADVLAGTFPPVDLIVSFSSLEHSGLGRYGDALNPDGDRSAVAQAWCMLRPGGFLVLGVPMTCAFQGEIVFNAHRVYGFERLAYVAANFELEGFVGGKCHNDNSQPILLLRKPRDISSPAPPLVAEDFYNHAFVAT